ncbi:hypothetical protein MMC12_002982 [Toensbergia leucococca]|nr:hypothetical protein [Toensbergia leucococca]
MIRNMRPLLLMIFHFFENYRIARTKSNNMDRAITSEDELVEVETRIMELYEPNDLYQAHAMYKFLILVITRKLRPPTYAGKMERSLRGWRQKPATSAEMAKLVVLGGLEAVAEVVKCDSYRARRTTLDKFLSRVLPPEEHDQRAKRSLPLLSSRISTSADTTNIKKKAKSIVKSDVTASQNKTPCLIMLPLNPNEAFELSNSLPDFNNLWYHAATKVLIKNGTVDSDDDLPCTRRFITYLETTREVENGDEHGNDGGGDDIPDTENDESIGESGDEAGDMETQL